VKRLTGGVEVWKVDAGGRGWKPSGPPKRFPDCYGWTTGGHRGRPVDCGGVAGHDGVCTVVDVEDGVGLGGGVDEEADLLSRMNLSNLLSMAFKWLIISKFGSSSGSATKRTAFFSFAPSMVKW